MPLSQNEECVYLSMQEEDYNLNLVVSFLDVKKK